MMAFVTKAAAPEPSPEPATSELPDESVQETASAADEPSAEFIAPAAGREAAAAEPAPEDGAAAAAAGGDGDGAAEPAPEDGAAAEEGDGARPGGGR